MERYGLVHNVLYGFGKSQYRLNLAKLKKKKKKKKKVIENLNMYFKHKTLSNTCAQFLWNIQFPRPFPESSNFRVYFFFFFFFFCARGVIIKKSESRQCHFSFFLWFEVWKMHTVIWLSYWLWTPIYFYQLFLVIKNIRGIVRNFVFP